MSALPDGVTICTVDVRTLSDDQLEELNDFSNRLKAESRPEDPPTPLEVTIAGARNIPSFVDVFGCEARTADGQLLGTAQGGVLLTGENEHLAQGGVNVLPEHRLQGIGRALLAELVAFADSRGRRLIMGGTTSAVPAGELFAKRVGGVAGLTNRKSSLDLKGFDRSLVDRWVEEGPGRAPGYRIETIVGRYPEDRLAEIAAISDVMNTAPRDELEMEDMHTTVEHLVEGERSLEASGTERWAMFVRHIDSGELVALTDVYWHPSNPTLVNQGNTGVLPEHRGHALGKWLKAAMLQKVLDERPEATCVRTANAYSNDAMVGINTELGFTEERSDTIWQLDVAAARSYLDAAAATVSA